MEEAHQADQQEQEQEQQEQQEQANQPDQKEGTAVGPGQDVPEGGGRAEYRIGIEGNAAGPVVAGNHNVVVDAQHGSTVTLLMERERPRPVRRSGVELLPRRQREPVGREAEITALTAAVQAGGPVQLWGPPGVGTSALLRYAARRLEPGPDGVLLLTAAHREVEDLAQEVFEACYEAAGYAPSETELRRLMTGVRVTVYVDNADLTPEQLQKLMDAAPDATFVFAGHERSLLGEGTVLELKGLDRTAGLKLFARELDRTLRPSEVPDAAALWKAAAGRPLLLLRAAGLARFAPSGDGTLPRPGAIADLIPLLLDQLDKAAMSVLHLLATLGDAELAPEHIGVLTSVPDPAALCERLAALGLVLPSEHGYRCVPDAVPAVRLRNPEPFPADRLCTHFAGWAARSATDPAQVALHSRALEMAIELAELAGRPDLAVKMARAASPSLARSLRFGDWGRLLGRGWVAAERAGDASAMAYFTHEEGIRTLLTGRRVISAVLLAEAVLLWRELGDLHGASAALHAQQYAPAVPHAATSAAAHGGTTGAAHGAAAHSGSAGAGSAAHTAGTSTAAHTAGTSTAGTSTAGTSSAAHSAHSAGTSSAAHSAGTTGAAHGTAAHSATTATAHTTAAHSATTHTAASHMASLGHSAAGHGAVPHLVHGAGHAAGHGAVHGAAHAAGHGAAHAAGHGAAHAATGSIAGSTATGTAATGTAAGVHAGAGVAAAVTAKGTSLAVVVLVSIASVTAVAIGVVPVVRDHLASSPSGTGSSSSQGATSAGTGSGSGSTATPVGNDLAGLWQDGHGVSHGIVASGPGTYTAANPGCNPPTVELTGSNGTYTGQEPLYADPTASCASPLGYAAITITVADDGSTAEVQTTGPSDGDTTCYTCGTETWTRQQAS
ncbi:ATP-binding protein [Streptomyces sp. NBC_01766]|uniref:ATP-binding protein n=1 Tax=Streptomyces sp. NBC_01766 TaxID=2975936 RepID=UPI002DD93383|nr:ATP-binding protein [Streptomyces sp. NBC_01766]WSC22236.1 ATP-binding protein [Streptomyces sp. NBC_01766]